MPSPLAIPLALALTALLLVGLRARRMAAPIPREVDREAPLAPSERLRVERWRRRLRAAFLVVVATYLSLAGLALADVAGSPARSVAGLWLLGGVCLLGARAQFSERCPRCGINLGFQARWTLADECDRCGGPWR